uniref:Kelch domain containing 1 n=1 Tax=Poecilia latipinna TaxID=48699 RepID=A0A3B3U8N1_9TELE
MDPAFERHCSELVARERSGHTAVVLDSLLYVWGGYMVREMHKYVTRSTEIYMKSITPVLRLVFHMSGEVPPSMSGTCGSSLGGNMYIFGGCDDGGQTNQMFCVDLTDGRYVWKKIIPLCGSAPSHRDKLSCWVDDLFWGWNNEVHVFDPVKGSWAEPQTHGRPPAPRAAHAGATLGRRGYVCGGRVMETRTNDLHCLDLESWTWTEMSVNKHRISWHTVTAVSESTMFLFGGLSVDCRPMSDGWLFDVETKKWREFEHPYQDKPRLWHTACGGRDSDVVVFGGSCDYILLVDTGHCNDALVFQMQPHPLFRICEDYIAKNVRTLERLRKQLPLLPPKMQKALQRRISFYRPSKNLN